MNKTHCTATEGATPRGLLPQHAADLQRKSGLDNAQIAACGFYSETDHRAIAALLGWDKAWKAEALGPFLCIPFLKPDGTPAGLVRVRPDNPRTLHGRRVKYESPRGRPNQVYFPAGVAAALADPSAPILITEGEKKAAKATQDGFATLGLIGVYGFLIARKKGKDGKKTGPRKLLPDLEGVVWDGRIVYVAYDSDLADKPEVRMCSEPGKPSVRPLWFLLADPFLLAALTLGWSWAVGRDEKSQRGGPQPVPDQIGIGPTSPERTVPTGRTGAKRKHEEKAGRASRCCRPVSSKRHLPAHPLNRRRWRNHVRDF